MKPRNYSPESERAQLEHWNQEDQKNFIQDIQNKLSENLGDSISQEEISAIINTYKNLNQNSKIIFRSAFEHFVFGENKDNILERLYGLLDPKSRPNQTDGNGYEPPTARRSSSGRTAPKPRQDNAMGTKMIYDS